MNERPGFYTVIDRSELASGEEICAERWLPSAPFTVEDFDRERTSIFRQMALAVANFPEAVDVTIDKFSDLLQNKPTPDREEADPAKLTGWFDISSGQSGRLHQISRGRHAIYFERGCLQQHRWDGPAAGRRGLRYALRGRHRLWAGVNPAVDFLRTWKRWQRGARSRSARPDDNRAALLARQSDQLAAVEISLRTDGNEGQAGVLAVVPPPSDLDQIGELGARMKRFRASVRHLTDFR